MADDRKGLTKMDNEWEAVRDGDTYCAPRCGGGCKWDDYTHACDEAATLAAVMKEATGLDWEPYVWENLGWHYQVLIGEKHDQLDGCIMVNPNIRHTLEERNILSGYTCFFNAPGKRFVTKSDNDPAAAFIKARDEADTFMAKMATFVANAKVV